MSEKKFQAGVLFLVILSFLPCVGCGAKRRLSETTARNAVMESLGLKLKKENMQVSKVSQVSDEHAVVEATVKTGFKFDLVNNRWVLREVRIGDRKWEDVDLVLEGIKKEKIARTRDLMTKTAEGLESYRKQFNQYPDVTDYQKLSDLLTPTYVPQVIRLDAWSNPFIYRFMSKDSYKLISMGPDEKEGTSDDIVMTNGRFE
jgi:hypothetical protein